MSCNHLDDAGTGFPKLCGTTNVQGNLVNGSTAGCGVPTKARTGRFVHVEHTREIRRDFEDDWRRIRETAYGGPWLGGYGGCGACYEGGVIGLGGVRGCSVRSEFGGRSF